MCLGCDLAESVRFWSSSPVDSVEDGWKEDQSAVRYVQEAKDQGGLS